MRRADLPVQSNLLDERERFEFNRLFYRSIPRLRALKMTEATPQDLARYAATDRKKRIHHRDAEHAEFGLFFV